MSIIKEIGDKIDSFSELGNDYSKIESFLFSYKNFLASFVERIISDDYELSRVAKESYSHSNYFDKIVLYKSKVNNFSLRLHIWDKDIHPQIKSDIHNHRWSFMSIVLLGTIIENNYTKISSKGNLEEFNYSLNKEKKESFEFQSEAKLLRH